MAAASVSRLFSLGQRNDSAIFAALRGAYPPAEIFAGLQAARRALAAEAAAAELQQEQQQQQEEEEEEEEVTTQEDLSKKDDLSTLLRAVVEHIPACQGGLQQHTAVPVR